ncbi:MAG: hypothetical protein ACI80H_000343 [Pseudoalteromonas distincta]|jgi:hypothetical protein
MDVGFAGQGRNAVTNNKKLRGARASYTKIRNLYVGVGNETGTPRISNLTPTQLVEGRKRAKAYYSKRNMRIYKQIIVTFMLACLIVWFALWYLLA